MKKSRSVPWIGLLGGALVWSAPATAQEHDHHPAEHADHVDHAQPAEAAAPRACPSIGNPARGGCTVEEYLLSLLHTEGVEAAMSALDSLAIRDAVIRRDAHAYAHAIGLAAFRDPETVGEVFGRCSPAHQSGCYHGVIQAYFLDHASTHGDHLDEALINGLCLDQRSPEASRWLLFQCAHGMGHGLLMIAGHHLPTALEWCDLVGDPWERDSCYGGAFMENIVHVTVPHHTPGRPDASEGHAAAGHDHHAAPVAQVPRDDFPALKREEPFYPCTVLAERYLEACYQMQTSAILYFNRQDLQATARLCATVPETLQPTCFQSLGRDISSITQQDHERAIRLCATAPAAFQPWCHTGYAKNLVDVTADARDGFDYCRLLPIGESKRFCYVAIGEQIWVLTESAEERSNMCAAAEPTYVAECRHGAGLADLAARRDASEESPGDRGGDRAGVFGQAVLARE